MQRQRVLGFMSLRSCLWTELKGRAGGVEVIGLTN